MAQKPRLAVLIDGENVSAKLANRLFGKIAHLGTSKLRRIYGNLQKPALKGWLDVQQQHHIDSRPDARHAKKKNVSDFTFVIDAMDLLHDNKFDVLCLISRDTDFVGLAQHVRNKGKLVYGVADAPQCLRDECAKLIDLTINPPPA